MILATTGDNYSTWSSPGSSLLPGLLRPIRHRLDILKWTLNPQVLGSSPRGGTGKRPGHKPGRRMGRSASSGPSQNFLGSWHCPSLHCPSLHCPPPVRAVATRRCCGRAIPRTSQPSSGPMSDSGLTDFQLEIARLFFALPAGGRSAGVTGSDHFQRSCRGVDAIHPISSICSKDTRARSTGSRLVPGARGSGAD